jgi:hypothetical protein
LNNLHVTVHGGISGEIANVLSSLFSQQIKSSAQNAIASAITEAIDSTLNEKIQEIPVTYNVNYGPLKLVFDYSLNNIIVNPRGFVVTAFKARFQPENAQPVLYPFSPAPMPDVPQAQEVTGDLLLSDFIFNTASYAATASGQLKFVVTPDMVPPQSPIKLDTASIGKVIPAVAKYYPNPLPVQMTVGVVTYPTAIETTDGLAVTANISCLIEVIDNSTTITTAFVLHLNLYTHISHVAAQALNNGATLNITGLVDSIVFDMYATDSTIGDVDLTTLKMLFNAMVINGYAKKYIQQLSTGYIVNLDDIVTGLRINHPVVRSSQGYVALGGAIAWHPPKTLLVPRRILMARAMMKQ